MGRSNPNGRGYASAHNSQITNQFTAGGNKKSGLGTHIGMGQFTYAAIVNGAAGHTASLVSGRSWLAAYSAPVLAGGAGLVGAAAQYPVSNVNQLGGIGRRWANMFGPSADGVNTAQINAGIARVRAGPRTWGL